jgi:hypothetical protein
MRTENKTKSVIIASVTVAFVGFVSLALATVNVGDDFNFQSAYRFLNASTSSVLGGLSVGTSTAQTPGTVYSTGNITSLGNLIGSLSAVYVSSAAFGSTAGKGNYTFQAAANTNPVLFVDATNERVGVGNSSPNSKLSLSGVADLSNNKITSLGTPTVSTDAATKAYVDAASPTFNYVYIYLSTSTTNGNLGGYSGANTFCQNNKPALVPNGLTYKAYLCSGSTCQYPTIGRNTMFIGISKSSSYMEFKLMDPMAQYNVLKDGCQGSISAPAQSLSSMSSQSIYRMSVFNVDAGMFWSGSIGHQVTIYPAGVLTYDLWGGGQGSDSNCSNWTVGTSANMGDYGITSTNFNQNWVAAAQQGCQNTAYLLCYAY